MCVWKNVFLAWKLIKCLIGRRKKMAVVLHRSRMWGPQVRLLSIVTPNTLWSLTLVICWLPAERCADGAWSSCCFWRVVSIMYFIFDELRDIWLRCVHSATSERHDWRTDVIAGTSCPDVWHLSCHLPTCHIVQKGYVKLGRLYRWKTGEVLGQILGELQIKLS